MSLAFAFEDIKQLRKLYDFFVGRLTWGKKVRTSKENEFK
jgi:hypothetical protein